MNTSLNIDDKFIKETLKQVLIELIQEQPHLILDALQNLNQEVLAEQIPKKRPLPAGAGKYNSGRSDVSTRAEELLFLEQTENIQKRKST